MHNNDSSELVSAGVSTCKADCCIAILLFMCVAEQTAKKSERAAKGDSSLHKLVCKRTGSGEGDVGDAGRDGKPGGKEEVGSHGISPMVSQRSSALNPSKKTTV